MKNRRIHDIINLLYSEIKRYEENNKKGGAYFNLKTRSFEDNPELPPVIRAEYGEYYFYVDYFEPMNITATRYTELHRVNKLTGADDIMSYAVEGDNDYDIDVVRNY